MIKQTALWKALHLDDYNPPIIAIVGAGGKTSLLYRLGEEAIAMNHSALLSGTTLFTLPKKEIQNQKTLEETNENLLNILTKEVFNSQVVIAKTGTAPKKRQRPISVELIDKIAKDSQFRLIALESDGSKMRPFKAPAVHEPVIPKSATHVIYVIGLSAVDKPLSEDYVHRSELVRKIAGPATHCTIEVISKIATSLQGGKKGVNNRDFTILINQSELNPSLATELAKTIFEKGNSRVIVASLRNIHHPILEIYQT
tara:strand:- start:10675 stop:11442 length:768 start_codon:yes stop_codon:yes gene_type:complete